MNIRLYALASCAIIISNCAMGRQCPAEMQSEPFDVDGLTLILSKTSVAPNIDIIHFVQSNYGPDAKLVDWTTLKKLLVNKTANKALTKHLRFSTQESDHSCNNYLVSFNGATHVQGMRFLFTKHDGRVPSNWSPIDDINNHEFDLGRWNWSGYPIIAIPKPQDQMPKAETQSRTPSQPIDNGNDRSNTVTQPKNQSLELGVRYEQYIAIKKCFDQRNGYQAVYLTQAELEQGRSAVKSLENRFKQENQGFDVDKLWNDVNQNGGRYQGLYGMHYMTIGSPDEFAPFAAKRSACQTVLEDLKSAASKLDPTSNIVKKDF